MVPLLALACASAQPAEIDRISIANFEHGSAAVRAVEVSRLRAAFQRQGMVILIDHGVPDEVIRGTIDESRRFFALPRARKEMFKELAGKPPRSYSAVTTPRGKGFQVQQEDDGAVLNEWLLVRNTSVQFDPSDPHYTSNEGREFHSSEELDPSQATLWPDEVPRLQSIVRRRHPTPGRLRPRCHPPYAHPPHPPSPPYT